MSRTPNPLGPRDHRNGAALEDPVGPRRMGRGSQFGQPMVALSLNGGDFTVMTSGFERPILSGRFFAFHRIK